MKVAFVYNKFDSEKFAEQWLYCVGGVANLLKDKGHKTDLASKLEDLPLSLDNYDVAVSHPYFDDVTSFNQELKKRSDFRLIIHSIVGERHMVKEMADSNQVYVFGMLLSPRSYQKLVDLIEKGW